MSNSGPSIDAMANSIRLMEATICAFVGAAWAAVGPADSVGEAAVTAAAGGAPVLVGAVCSGCATAA